MAHTRSLHSARLVAIGLLLAMGSMADSSWRQSSQAGHTGGTASELERYSLTPIGLRRIQRRPELFDPLDEENYDSTRPASIEHTNIPRQAARKLLPQAYSGQMHQKRSISGLEEAKELPQGGPHEFLYVIAPISEQALPFQRSKVDQGYNRFVNLPGPNYRTGLGRSSSEAGSLTIEDDFSGNSVYASPSCRTSKSKIRLAREEFDQTTGQLVRECSGLIELSSCEGECVSSVQPSVKAPGGFMKRCSCCNEGSLRQVVVRLNECWPANDQNQRAIEAQQAAGYMDILVDEPTECKCRPCDAHS